MTPDALSGTVSEISTWLSWRPSPGALKSGIRLQDSSKRHWVYGEAMRSSGCMRVHNPAPTGHTS